MRSDARKRTADPPIPIELTTGQLLEQLAVAWDEGYRQGAAEWDGINLTDDDVASAHNPYRSVAGE